jgi:hypothetical protein
MGFLDGILGPFGKKVKDKASGLTEESASTKQQRADLNDQGRAAGDFAAWGESGYHGLGREGADVRDMLRRQATGQESVTREMLRQGLQQGLAQQRSMAAGAAPQNQAMAARTAAMNMGRATAGMSGAAAVAGMQERQAAAKALADAINAQRAMELQAALGSRQNAISGYGGVKPEGTWLEKNQGWINMGQDIGTTIAKGGK